jgi:Na+-transporting NADH:ubiquinone oxidoreductase subunit NqrB
MLTNDARLYQIGFLGLFLLLGIGTRDWTLQPELIVLQVLTCVGMQGLVSGWVQHSRVSAAKDEAKPVEVGEVASGLAPDAVNVGILERLQGWVHQVRPSLSEFWAQLPSALITALGLSLLLRANQASTIILAGTCAILSKAVLRFRGKHIFNPANFGLVAALLLTPDAWISPGQWGEGGWYALLFLGAGGLVLQKVGRWDTTLGFLVTYAGLEALRNVWLGWSWDVWAHRLISGSLLLFALFMVTDPRTIPNARQGRLIWAGAIALLSFILRNVFFNAQAVFWALFALAPLTMLLDLLLPSPRFTWIAVESTN